MLFESKYSILKIKYCYTEQYNQLLQGVQCAESKHALNILHHILPYFFYNQLEMELTVLNLYKDEPPSLFCKYIYSRLIFLYEHTLSILWKLRMLYASCYRDLTYVNIIGFSVIPCHFVF